MHNLKGLGKFYRLTAPLVGAFLTALFLAIRAFVQSEGNGDVILPFVVWFLTRSVIGYVLALPLLLIAKRLGLRQAFGFMIISLLAAIPYEWYVSDPMNAWHPTEAEIDHGIYWASFIVSIVLAACTGICFSLGVSQKRTA